MALDIVSQSRCFGGTQFIYQHQSTETGTAMRFAAFIPPRADQRPVPIVWYLSGLTCTEENFTVKAGAQRVASELGLLLIAPDTSPRGDAVPGDPAGSYDFGLGAGFYVDATQPPWSRNYRMASYVERELPGLISSELPADVTRQSIMGHSMGGHGALTIALRNQGRYAVRHRNRSINETYDRIYVVSLGAPKRNLTAFVSPPGEERRRTARLCSGLLVGGRRHERHHPARQHC